MQEETKQSLWPTRLQEHAASGQPIRAWCANNGPARHRKRQNLGVRTYIEATANALH